MDGIILVSTPKPGASKIKVWDSEAEELQSQLYREYLARLKEVRE